MAQILTVDNDLIRVGDDDGQVITVPITAVNYANPKVGDKVKIFHDGDKVIIAWDGPSAAAPAASVGAGTGKNITINKHLFVWLGTFLFGSLGVDRFMRGQIGLGIAKLLLCTLGWMIIVGGFAGWIWSIVDFIVALTKAYGTFSSTENLTFVNGDYSN